jgi:hypothetical protein
MYDNGSTILNVVSGYQEVINGRTALYSTVSNGGNEMVVTGV